MTFEQEEPDLVVSDDGRFSGKAALWGDIWWSWLRQVAGPRRRASERNDPGTWVVASACGALSQAMAFLSAPAATRWRLCAGNMSDEGYNMYYWLRSTGAGFEPQMVPARPIERDEHATEYERAVVARQLFEDRTLWALKGPKLWSIPFLEPVIPYRKEQP